MEGHAVPGSELDVLTESDVSIIRRDSPCPPREIVDEVNIGGVEKRAIVNPASHGGGRQVSPIRGTITAGPLVKDDRYERDGPGGGKYEVPGDGKASGARPDVPAEHDVGEASGPRDCGRGK